MTLLLLRRPNMRIMNLRSKLQTRQSLTKMILHRRHHNKHERFRVPTERVLKEVS